MSLLSAAEDLDMQGEWEGELTDLCTINDKVPVESDSGGSTTTLNPVASNIPCSVAAIMAEEVVAGARQTVFKGWQIGLRGVQAVNESQVITNSRGAFQITGSLRATHEFGTVLTAKEWRSAT